jgi:hypothetical protein
MNTPLQDLFKEFEGLIPDDKIKDLSEKYLLKEKEHIKTAYNKGGRMASVNGMRVARGGELNITTADEYFNKTYTEDVKLTIGYLNDKVADLEEKIKHKSDPNNIWFMRGCISTYKAIIAKHLNSK